MSNLQKIIAVIDDDPEMRAALVMLLRSYGYNVETFDSAETFLTFASKCRATCLLVDIQRWNAKPLPRVASRFCASRFRLQR
jgi:FixJ family two-component response regulator